jgi:enoyl-CoA hydratase
VAMNPLDVLSVHKHVTNRCLEVTGIRVAALEGAEFDAIAHLTPAFKEFGRRTNEDGLRAALAWRDGPYSTGPLPEHDAAIRRHR